MALFKILKGGKANIGTTTTPLHDGYAYFTYDEGGFYIDTSTERTKINPGTEILYSATAPTPKSKENAIWFVTEASSTDSSNNEESGN